MELAQQYLAKYTRLVPPEGSKKKIIVTVVRDECGIVLEETAVSFTRGGVLFEVHPAVRSELLRSAPAILHTLHTAHHLRFSFLR